ncbi:MAG: serine/threonine protein phosphatase, partial [Dolichospermum sp.]
VKYSEPDLTIAVDISQVLANTELDPLNDQKTQVVTENKTVNKTVKFSQIPLQLFVILGLTLLAFLLGYWFKLTQLQSPRNIIPSHSPSSSQSPP